MKSILILTALLLATSAAALNDMTQVGLYTGEGEDDSFGSGLTMGDFDDDGHAEYIIGAIGWNEYQGKNYYYDWNGT